MPLYKEASYKPYIIAAMIFRRELWVRWFRGRYHHEDWMAIMASGEGKRFGSNKMLADILGEPLIARAIDSVPGALTSWFRRVGRGWPGFGGPAFALGGCRCGAAHRERALGAFSWGADATWRVTLFFPGDQPLLGSGFF